MSKRQHGKWELTEKDYYPTVDPKAFPTKFIEQIRGKSYAEPCYGKGHIEDHLMDVARCRWRSDIDAYGTCSVQKDALKLTDRDLYLCDLIITNPPYSWFILKELLEYLPTRKPTWLLLPADKMHNVNMGPYMEKCSMVISVGRLYWMEDKPVRGVDNYAWFKFHNTKVDTIFIGREK